MSELLKWYDGLSDEERASLDGGTLADIEWEQRKYGMRVQPTLKESLLEYERKQMIR